MAYWHRPIAREEMPLHTLFLRTVALLLPREECDQSRKTSALDRALEASAFHVTECGPKSLRGQMVRWEKQLSIPSRGVYCVEILHNPTASEFFRARPGGECIPIVWFAFVTSTSADERADDKQLHLSLLREECEPIFRVTATQHTYQVTPPAFLAARNTVPGT